MMATSMPSAATTRKHRARKANAPDAFTTVLTDSSSAVTATRPVYPYPAVAKFSGTGDWHDAANWAKGSALYDAPTRSWAGASFYAPYTPKTQGVAAP